MKLEIEIDEEDIKKAIIQNIASRYEWQLDTKKKDDIFKAVDWSKMAPHIQEAILRMAADKFFGDKK